MKWKNRPSKKGKGFPYPNRRRGSGGYSPTVSLAQQMKGGAHRCPFAASSKIALKVSTAFEWPC